MIPFKDIAPLPLHTETSAPALAVGAGLTVTIIVSVTTGQLPPDVEAITLVIPALISAGESVYTTVAAFAFGVKVPPLPFHVCPVAFVIVTDKFTAGLFAQTEAGAVTVTVGAGVNDNVIELLTALQLPFPVVVNVRVTLLPVRSVLLGL